MEHYNARLGGFKAYGAGGFALDTRTGKIRPLSFDANSIEILGSESDTVPAPGATTGPSLKQ